MWRDSFSPDEPLSQGDFIDGLQFPIVKLPIAPTPTPDGRGECAVLGLRSHGGIVVTQCCIIDKNQTKHVVVAPVRPEGGLKEGQAAALTREEPPHVGDEDPEAGYVYDAFHVEGIDGILDAPPRTLLIADLKMVIAFGGDLNNLKANRRAKMTAAGRRLLRIKLAAFWGRATEEDAADLRAQGLPVGLSPPA